MAAQTEDPDAVIWMKEMMDVRTKLHVEGILTGEGIVTGIEIATETGIATGTLTADAEMNHAWIPDLLSRTLVQPAGVKNPEIKGAIVITDR